MRNRAIIATELTASGIGELYFYDHDTVKLSNLSRQTLYEENDIGASKSIAAKKHLERLNGDVKIYSQNLRINGSEDLIPIMQSCDLFVNGIDFPGDIIFDVNNSAIVTDTPWMNASYKGPCYAVTIFVPSMTPCFRCLLHKIETKKKAFGVEEEYLNDNFPAPIIGPVAEIAGSSSSNGDY